MSSEAEIPETENTKNQLNIIRIGLGTKSVSDIVTGISIIFEYNIPYYILGSVLFFCSQSVKKQSHLHR